MRKYIPRGTICDIDIDRDIDLIDIPRSKYINEYWE